MAPDSSEGPGRGAGAFHFRRASHRPSAVGRRPVRPVSRNCLPTWKARRRLSRRGPPRPSSASGQRALPVTRDREEPARRDIAAASALPVTSDHARSHQQPPGRGLRPAGAAGAHPAERRRLCVHVTQSPGRGAQRVSRLQRGVAGCAARRNRSAGRRHRSAARRNRSAARQHRSAAAGTVARAPRKNFGTPRALVARPRALVARPRALVARPRALVARPRTLVARPRALVARPRTDFRGRRAARPRPRAARPRPRAARPRPRAARAGLGTATHCKALDLARTRCKGPA
jgi:hypothetical protein